MYHFFVTINSEADQLIGHIEDIEVLLPTAAHLPINLNAKQVIVRQWGTNKTVYWACYDYFNKKLHLFDQTQCAYKKGN